MKLKITLFLLFVVAMANGQNTLTVTYTPGNPAGSRLVKTTTDAQATAFDPTQQITVVVTGCPVSATVSPSFNGNAKAITPGGVIAPLAAAEINAYASYSINIVCNGNSATYTNIANPGGGGGGVASNVPSVSAVDYLNTVFTIASTNEGLTVSAAPGLVNYRYIGDNYTHIFLDQFGNNIMGAIPQGISNRQYVVDVIFLANSKDPTQITYSLKQTKGSFNPSLLFNNAGAIGNFAVQGTNGSSPPVKYIWATQAFPLRISTDNIEFELQRNVIASTNPITLQSSVVATQTIEMTKVYHGSFDIGLVSSRLADPTYELLPSANDPAQQVAKRNNFGRDRGMVTVMATLYTSPIVLFKKYVLKKEGIPDYKLYGRNFLDDHTLIERIFPVVGVSVSDKSFKNLFCGFNWEIARGASIFAGIHYAEVNSFDKPEGFEFGTTVITEAEFKLRQNKKWEKEFAFGVNLDLLIVTNLFKR